MQKHLFLQYQFQQHPQMTLLMKSEFYFFPGMQKLEGNNQKRICLQS